MHEIRRIDLFCVLSVFVLSSILVLFGVFLDSLLFASDLASLLHFILGLTLMISSILFIPVLISFRVLGAKAKEGIASFLSSLVLTNILFGFTVNAASLFDVLVYQIKPRVLFLALTVVLYGVSYGAVILMSRGKPLEARVINFARRATLFSFVVLAVLVSFGYLRKGTTSPEGGRKNVVMIVIDGLSTRALPFYNPGVASEEFEEIARESRLYTKAYTNLPYTSGYFSVLYSGRKDGAAGRRNLLSALQGAGVNTRYMFYHTNGVPDAHRITSYRGLRSLYLHSRLSWIPHLLGVDYNARFDCAYKLRKQFWRRRIAYGAIKKLWGRAKKDSIEAYLPDEIERLRGGRRPYFLLLHMNFHHFSKPKKKNKPPAVLRAGGARRARLEAKIIDNDCMYGKEKLWLVRKLRKIFKNTTREGIKSLKIFYDIYKKRGWDKDTILIITADHGKIFSGGKLWYGYHSEEEVTRVPLLIRDGENTGIDARLCETIDITETILRCFGIDEPFSRKAVSLIGDGTKPLVTSLTLPKTKRKERFLNIYKHKGDLLYKYVIDLEGEGGAKKMLVEGIDETVVDEGHRVFRDIYQDLREVLNDYNVEYSRVGTGGGY